MGPTFRSGGFVRRPDLQVGRVVTLSATRRRVRGVQDMRWMLAGRVPQFKRPKKKGEALKEPPPTETIGTYQRICAPKPMIRLWRMLLGTWYVVPVVAKILLAVAVILF